MQKRIVDHRGEAESTLLRCPVCLFLWDGTLEQPQRLAPQIKWTVGPNLAGEPLLGFFCNQSKNPEEHAHRCRTSMLVHVRRWCTVLVFRDEVVRYGFPLPLPTPPTYAEIR